MQLARVLGSVVAPEKAEGLDGVRFLVIEPLDKHQEPTGATIVSSREAAEALPQRFVPVDHAIIGIVDHVHLGANG